MLQLHNLRQDYRLKSLDLKNLKTTPFSQFVSWFQEAQKAKIPECNAMALATASPEGRPSCRMVLLKKMDDQGFMFFTNAKSRKGKDLALNPFACATIHWKELERQVILDGTVELLPLAEIETYFASRPRGSQLSSWASCQDQPLSSRRALEESYLEYEKKFAGASVPKPPDWVGYKLIPDRFEFWQGRPNRLHDRFSYYLTSDGWRIERLSP